MSVRKALWLLALLCGHCAAADITINGSVVASPCTVDTDTQDKIVAFQPLQARDLNDAGSAGEWQDFTLLLTECPVGTHSAIVQFSGTPDAADASAFANSGTASHVALRLAAQSDKAQALSNNSTWQTAVDDASHQAQFKLTARLFTPEGHATAGTFHSLINVDFIYQ